MKKITIATQLKLIDWDFSAVQKGVTSLPHWYPGTFTSQVPSALIQSLTRQGDIIFDPFSGVGTTAAEAIRLGRRVWVTDLNPISALSSFVFCGLLALKKFSNKDFEAFFKNVIDFIDESSQSIFCKDMTIDQHALNIQQYLDAVFSPDSSLLESTVVKRSWINNEALESWIHKSTLLEIEEFSKRVLALHSSFARLFFYYMISSNIRSLSSQVKSWGHIADNVKPKSFTYKHTGTLFKKWVLRFLGSLRRAEVKPDNNFFDEPVLRVDVYDWSSSEVLSPFYNNPISAIITSPPYGDAIDYLYSQKLSLYALGYTEEEIKALVSREIGARRKRFNKDSRRVWAEELADAVDRQAKFVESGFIAAILPHKNHGREVGLNLMREKLELSGWSVFFEVDRSISQKKTRQSWTSIKQETISIFSKG